MPSRSVPRPRLAFAQQLIHTATIRLRHPPKRAAPIYLTQEWSDLRRRLIGQLGYGCEKCGRTRDDQGQSVRIYLDHRVELIDHGDPFDETNLQLLCASCHTNKTVAERIKRLSQG